MFCAAAAKRDLCSFENLIFLPNIGFLLPSLARDMFFLYSSDLFLPFGLGGIPPPTQLFHPMFLNGRSILSKNRATFSSRLDAITSTQISSLYFLIAFDKWLFWFLAAVLCCEKRSVGSTLMPTYPSSSARLDRSLMWYTDVIPSCRMPVYRTRTR